MENEVVTTPKKIVPLRWLRNMVIGLILLAVGGGIGYQVRDYNLLGKVRRTAMPVGLNRNNLDFTMFWQVWDRLEEVYVEPEKLDSQKMVYGAIEGMTAALGDPYTIFLPPQENQQAKEDLNGEFDGVGIQLGYKKDTVAVMSPLEGHPAIRAGVRAGDLILNIKDEGKGVDASTVDMTLIEAVKLIRGKKGTPVTLSLYRENKGQFEVTLIRDTIVVPSVELELGDWQGGEWQESPKGKVAWLKLTRFGDKTGEEWDEAVEKILTNNNLSGIVLDLRNNPGGYLQGAINLASEFIADGVVVKQQSRTDTETFSVNRKGRLIGVPIVILINGGSASSSEILSGALRDRIGAKLVGEKSFGKGTVQEAIDLAGNAGLHVTIAKWLLPSGEWIHDTGLKPDIEVELPEVDSASESGTLIDTQLQKAVEVLKEL